MGITIHDVAREAGVSISTVSRALSGKSSVREEKRRLVVEAAEALGYTPNPAARSLLSKRTGGLGVLLPFVNGEFFSELLSGMDEAAQALDQFLVISTSHRRSGEFRKAAQAMLKRVDGLVVMAPEIDVEGAAEILRADVPVVFVNTQGGDGMAADVLNFDNRAGARALTRHLIGLGHRRIALIRGPQTAWDAHERALGYRDAMAEAGLDPAGLEFEGGYTREEGHASAEAILAADPRPTAIVAANDYCALGALSALHQAGVEVPADVSVCGFDGLASARYALPPLTTARVPIEEIGEQAVRHLVGRIEKGPGAGPYRHDVLPVEVLLRASTAAP